MKVYELYEWLVRHEMQLGANAEIEFCIFDEDGFEEFVKPIDDIKMVWNDANEPAIQLY